MAVDSDIIDSESIDSIAIDSNTIGLPGIQLTNRALCILNDTETTQVFGSDTWNLLENAAGTQSTIVNPSNVVTGWSVANSTYSENALSLTSLPFYDAGVYAIARCSNNPAVAFTLTISGLNDSAQYTFIFSGATSSSTGAGTREMTITSSVSAETAIVLTDPSDATNDHLGTIPLQSPSGGTIVLTLTSSGVSSVQMSTFDIQEFS